MRKTLPLILCVMFSTAAFAQQPQTPAPPRAYKPVALTLPEANTDPGIDALRKQISLAANKKDRAALSKLVVARNFFWDRENGDGADKKKSGADNLVAALGLAGNDSAGWDLLTYFAEDPTASASPDRKGAVCAPADPGFKDAELEKLLADTKTDISEWGYPVRDGVDVRESAAVSSPVTEKLGLHFVRVVLDNSPAAAVSAALRIVTPSGKTGFVPQETIAPIGGDQICYVKDGGGWKIGGYVGGGTAR